MSSHVIADPHVEWMLVRSANDVADNGVVVDVSLSATIVVWKWVCFHDLIVSKRDSGSQRKSYRFFAERFHMIGAPTISQRTLSDTI